MGNNLSINNESSNEESETNENSTLESLSLFWVNSRKDLSFEKRLREEITTNVKIFNDPIICQRYLKSTCDNQQIFVIISGDLAKRLFAYSNEWKSNLKFIYIYPEITENHIELINNHPKLRLNSSQLNQLFHQLIQDRIYFENIQTAKSLIYFKDPTYCPIVGQVDNRFIFFKIFIEILLSNFYLSCSCSFQPLIDLLRQQINSTDESSLDLIQQFQSNYQKNKSIEYLIENTPLSRFVNKALREQNIPMLFYLRFFLIDISQELKKSNEQISSIVVYQKALISVKNFENIRGKNCFYIMFNELMLTSKERPSLNDEIENEDNEYMNVIFEINATNHDSNVNFGLIDDKHILFMCASIFKIKSVIKHSNSIYIIELILEENQRLKSLNIQLINLRQTKDLFIIEDLLNKTNQTNKISVFYQSLLQQLDKHHPLTCKVYDRFIMNKHIQPISLTYTKVYVFNLWNNLSCLSQQMLNSLRLLTNDTIEICDNISQIDFNQRLIILTTNQSLKLIKDKTKITSKYFIFEEHNEQLIDNKEYFNQSEKLIFRFAKELFDNYIWESNRDSIDIAQQKQFLAQQIRIELKKVYRNNQFDIKHEKIVDIPINIFWLKFHEQSNEYINKCRSLLTGIVSNVYEFDNANDCYLELCTNLNENLIYLIIDDEYQDTDIILIHQIKSIQQIFRYKQPNSNAHSLIENFVLLSLIHKLIQHFYHLIDLCQTNRDQFNLDNFNSKKDQLSKLILQIQNLK